MVKCKLITLIIIILATSIVSASYDICTDTREINEDCKMVTPNLINKFCEKKSNWEFC